MKKHLFTSIFILSLAFAFCLLLSCEDESGDGTITLQGGDPNVDPLTQTEKLTGGTTFTSNDSGNWSLPGSPYGWGIWPESSNNKLTWYGPNRGGGAAFKAEWYNYFIGSVGYYLGSKNKYTVYKNLYCGFNYTRSGNTAGYFSYIGIYGWSRNPLIEYYIVEDWFGNQGQADTMPVTTNTTGGTVVGSFTVDGSVYQIIKNKRVDAASIDGDNMTFDQYFSVRQKPRKSGTISITEHFKKWEELGMKLGNMESVLFFVEAGETAWIDASYLTFYQKD